MNGGVQVVWLKRDLRIEDHAPITEAAARGPCLVLYVYEPEVLTAETFDAQHLTFINQSLAQLDAELHTLGARLTVRSGAMPDVLATLHEEVPIAALWSHEETGDAVTYARDERVRAWTAARRIPWHELPQTGVVRRLRSRDGWSRRWQARMEQPLVEAPAWIEPVAGVASCGLQEPGDLGVATGTKHLTQRGGEAHAHELLTSFLERRGRSYRSDMSSPVTAWDGGSRLSPHLAYGTISMRQVHQATEARRRALRAAKAAGEPSDGPWLQSLSSFAGRLRWHCHFMQKLEDEPRLEFENMSRAYDGLREDEFDAERFAAWCEGRTGYPMVDACMRCLQETGWINFRMRAMLVSFASYHLWLHWRPTAVYLARQFLDYEPGIHYSQVQMQSGVTGINAVRIYSPIKQVRDQDPQGRFIRRWLPELARVPDAYLPEPHTMPPAVQSEARCRVGSDYPAPLVEHKTAYAEARRRMTEVRRRESARAEAEAVYAKHGSRRRPQRRRSAR